ARSATDPMPLFEAIVSSAARLFEPCSATITTRKGEKLYWDATASSISGYNNERASAIYPIPFDPERSSSARAMLDRRTIQIPDVAAPDTPDLVRKAAAAGGFRSITFVPLVDRQQGIGTIIFTHPQAGFTPTTPEADAGLQAFYPRPLSAFTYADAISRGEIHQIVDAETELATQPDILRLTRQRGWRSAVWVPLLREGKAIGMIRVTRR